MAPAPRRALVSLTGISKYFGEGETRVDALRDISFDIAPGEVVALRGPSLASRRSHIPVARVIVHHRAFEAGSI